jgi:hypothetical protein
MRIIARQSADGVAQRTRHSEVDQETSTGFEPNNQILASALERTDSLTFELRRDRLRLERTHEPRIPDLDFVEPPADDKWLECETNRLDLGQLRHQAIVSKMIGVAGGASSPSR